MDLTRVILPVSTRECKTKQPGAQRQSHRNCCGPWHSRLRINMVQEWFRNSRPLASPTHEEGNWARLPLWRNRREKGRQLWCDLLHRNAACLVFHVRFSSIACCSLIFASSSFGAGLQPQFFVCSRCHSIRSFSVAPFGILCCSCHSRFIVPPRPCRQIHFSIRAIIPPNATAAWAHCPGRRR